MPLDPATDNHGGNGYLKTPARQWPRILAPALRWLPSVVTQVHRWFGEYEDRPLPDATTFDDDGKTGGRSMDVKVRTDLGETLRRSVKFLQQPCRHITTTLV